MRRFAPLLALVLILAACGGAKDAETPPPMPPAPTLADFAGTWQMTTTLNGVADPVTSTMTGTADAAGWTISLEGRPNVALTVSVVGDSLIAQSAEYESVLRKGVMVSIRTAAAKTDAGVSGTVMATYKTSAGEELVAGTMTGTKQM